MKEYALYKGDTLLGIGTITELAEITGKLPKTLRFYGAPSYQKRAEKRKNSKNCLILICLD
jgi:hypothetical protein